MPDKQLLHLVIGGERSRREAEDGDADNCAQMSVHWNWSG